MPLPTPEEWRRLSPLFDELLDLPGEQRSAWIAEHSDLSPQDREHLRELLATHEKTELGLDKPLPEVAQEAVASGIVDGLVGSQLGPFQIDKEIGRGGMGVVYAAKRTGEFEQEVVIKVLRIGLDSQAMRQRFERERQILADLNHPAIVRLLDGGFTPDGRPYLVMNRIDGQPIDAYCNQQTLDLKARVRLFLNVIEAVDHAHTHLVIHRDIKPSNIWVDQAGKIHLLDFGIAKIADESVDASLTDTMQRAMTPEYASPEQFRRGAITTATDVYQLGALLYQLLTGQQTFQLKGQSPAQLEQQICDTDPIAPSRAVTTSTGTEISAESSIGQMKKLLSGDMDLILQKSLRKEPERRYASAHEFRQDLINWLSGDRIMARPNSFSYQLQRLVKRNPLAATFTATVLVFGIVFGVFHVQRITSERDLAQLEAQRRQEVSDFLVNLLKVPDPTKSEGREITARELIEDSFPRINDDLSDPETKARLLEVVGEVASNLGLYDQAVPAMTDVVRYKAEIYGPRSAEVAQAKLLLAIMYRHAHEAESALEAATEALAIRREIYPAEHIEIGRALIEMALVHRSTRDFELAEQELREAKAIIDADLPATDVLNITVVADLALVLRAAGKAEEAEQLYRQVIPQMRAREQDFGAQLPGALNNLGYLIRKKEEYAEAEVFYREAILHNESHYGKFHPSTLMFRNNLASVLMAQDKESEVIAELKTIIEMQEHLTGVDHWRTAVAYRSLGFYYYAIGEYPLAVTNLRTSLGIFESVLAPGHLWTMRTVLQLSLCLDLVGSNQESEELWRTARPVLSSEEAQQDRVVQSLLDRLSKDLPAGNERWQSRLDSLRPPKTDG